MPPAARTEHATVTAIAIQHRAQIIERVARGEYLATIAHDLGLKGRGQSISDYLASDPEYQAARERGLESKLAHREKELEGAAAADVPRARELLGHARWRAEREFPARWGQKTEVKSEGSLRVELVSFLPDRVATSQPSTLHPALSAQVTDSIEDSI